MNKLFSECIYMTLADLSILINHTLSKYPESNNHLILKCEGRTMFIILMINRKKVIECGKSYDGDDFECEQLHHKELIKRVIKGNVAIIDA